LSTSANFVDSNSLVDLNSSWKQEVNRRVAEHRKNKPSYADGRAMVREHRNDPASRAAQAAARVAARYANAPSYSELLAGEARAAMLAAEAASRAAHAAHAAAQSVLDSLEAASSRESASGPAYNPPRGNAARSSSLADNDRARAEDAAFAETPGEEHPDYALSARPSLERGGLEHGEGDTYAIRWEPELPARRPAPVPVRARQTPSLFDSAVQDWPEPGLPVEEGFALVEPAQPIYGNLIEFPRQLIATRKVRPRRVEGPLAAGENEAQLSIFEVDPGAISIDPATSEPVEEPSALTSTGTASTGPVWTGPEWSGMRLDAHPEAETVPHEAAPQWASTSVLDHASASWRLLAVVVDVSLVAGVFLSLAILAASRMTELPGVRTLEFGSAFALLIVGALYLALFFALARVTPGMLYARLRLCTFEGNAPTRAQRNARLVALLLSALPMGLGLAWAIFDEDHLAWHDRLSNTYLRRC
jgi:uncharacterized RDD family membrane protein YckC